MPLYGGVVRFESPNIDNPPKAMSAAITVRNSFQVSQKVDLGASTILDTGGGAGISVAEEVLRGADGAAAR
jgi:hypothetical protein